MNNLDPSKHSQIYGVIGNPIKHSLSPTLHNAVFEKRNIDARYFAFLCAKERLSGVVEGMKALRIGGLNVTLPFKEDIVHYLDTIPQNTDRAIGAINTLVLNDHEVLGFNTDSQGFIKDLEHVFNFRAKDISASILGAGGSARAVLFALLKSGCQKIYIHNRTKERVLGLIDYAKQYFPDSNIYHVDKSEEFSEAVTVLINCTSCGLKKEDELPVCDAMIARHQYCYDLIYAPQRTKLLTQAENKGLIVSNGIGMLIHQAALANAMWFPDYEYIETVEIMTEAYRQCT